MFMKSLSSTSGRFRRPGPRSGRTIHVRRPGTTWLDSVIIGIMVVALGLLLVVVGALIVIGVVDVTGAGEVFGRVLGAFWFIWGVGAPGTAIAEIRSDFPFTKDDSDYSGTGTTSREVGIELGDFDCDDGGD